MAVDAADLRSSRAASESLRYPADPGRQDGGWPNSIPQENPFMKPRTAVAVIAAVATIAVGTTIGVNLAGAAGSGTASAFVPIVPCRLVDTRPTDNVGERNGALNPGETLTLNVVGTHGNCNIPGGATGIASNVTVTNPTAPSFLTLFPADAAKPNSSNLNWTASSSPTPNQVTVRPLRWRGDQCVQPRRPNRRDHRHRRLIPAVNVWRRDAGPQGRHRRRRGCWSVGTQRRCRRRSSVSAGAARHHELRTQASVVRVDARRVVGVHRHSGFMQRPSAVSGRGRNAASIGILLSVGLESRQGNLRQLRHLGQDRLTHLTELTHAQITRLAGACRTNLGVDRRGCW